jgi:8-oxo-dGTP pyrophosphatase MutT (NUDIX family)
MPSLDAIRSALAAHEPRRIEPDRGHAAVALALRPGGGGPQVLLIERARCEGDPWSGHMAFPGGRVEPGDPDPRGAAERETLEEVGLALAGAEALGRLDDLQGRAGQPGLVISAFVFHVIDPPELSPNHEVQEAFWFPLSELRDPQRQVEYRERRLPGVRFPAIRVGEPGRQVVWGLTYRFLEDFFQLVGYPLPR